MIDVESRLRAELHRFVTIDPRPDWDEVVADAGLEREQARRRQRSVLAVAVALAAVTVGLATPLGSAIARGLDGFSAWLTGQPGEPVSEEEQREFDAANARSWLGFPQGTELRRLIRRDVDGMMVELLGFRAGSSALCLRLNVISKSRTSTLECAPLEELRRKGGPVRVVMADQPVGRGDKYAWYGIDRVHSSNLQVTAGIASDGVESVVLEDEAGRHEVPVLANAFLYVAEQPEVGQRVKSVWARTSAGLIAVPFAPTAFGFGGSGGRSAAPPAPAVERTVSGGRIGWLERRELRGESLDTLPARAHAAVLGQIGGPQRPQTNVLFGRVLTPDPGRPLRIVVTLNAHRPRGPVAGLCTWLVERRGTSGGCSPYPGVFEQNPIPSGMTGGGSGAFVTVEGVASDDVARLEALLADKQEVGVPLNDNAFAVDLPRAKLPARLVAYDSDGRVISVSPPLHDIGGGASPARGRATSLLRVNGPNGTHAELFVGPSDRGGECMYIKHFVDRQHTGVMVGCKGRAWTGPALQLSSQFLPPRFIAGRVRIDIDAVRVRFADGTATTLRPTRGYVLYATPPDRLTEARGAVSAEGLNADGGVVARQSFRPPTR